MKKSLLSLLIMITSLSYAQINYEPGYFVNNSNIRTECLIKNAATYNNPVSFEYRLNESDEVQIGKINDVKEFAVGDGYHYRRFETDIDQSNDDAGKLSHQKDPEWKKETVFLKLLFAGDVTLYQYEHAGMTRYFISSGNHQTAEQLVHKEYMTRETGSSIFSNNLFRRQLLVALQSPQLQQSDFEKLKYRKDSLLKLFLKYGNQEGKTFSNLDEKQNKSVINFRITAGVGLANFEISDYLNTFQHKLTGTAYRIGVELEAILPFGQNKWALFLDPNFQSFNDKGSADVKFSNNDLHLEVDYKQLQLPAGVRHYIFLKRSKLFLDGGLNINLPLGSTIKNGGSTIEIGKSVGFFGGLGYNYGRYSFEGRYSFKQNVLKSYVNWKGDYSSIGLVASYKFL